MSTLFINKLNGYKDKKMNELQKCILNIFKEVKKVCEHNNIPYYALGGTAIGAVRHKGFIPWDDDLDIALPIEYLEYFLECCKKDLPPRYKIFSAKNVKEFSNVFIKVVDTETTFIEKDMHFYKNSYTGVFIDIIFLISVPDNLFKKKFHLFRLRYYRIMHLCRNHPFKDIEKLKGKYKAIKKIISLFIKHFVSEDFFFDKWLNYIKKYPIKMGGYKKLFNCI